ncbi:MAG TPA: NAD-dependent succinate-semialdehyde dehydrogenase [Steroidobacter sp.]|uniref:NAD-dependent succinate-semialdehyde dehydrogenase n=1 Tax=Steroidobacter sp. TaxID=1978227 RepID=UPI002ED9BF97
MSAIASASGASMSYAPPRQFIDGQWREGGGEELIGIVDPASETEIGSFVAASPADINTALQAAARAFQVWRKAPAWERGKRLRKIAELLLERRAAIAATLTAEQGKPFKESLSEVDTAAATFEWFAEEGRRAYGRIIPPRACDVVHEVIKQPIGVIAAFTPWNFPLLTPARKIAAALAAGCTCIIKPAEETPASCAALMQICADAQLPGGVVNMLLGSPEAISTALVAAPSVAKISFTGSAAVGRILMRRAAEYLKPTTMELGGHAPVLVFDDADVEAAAFMGVASKFRNAGQLCISPTRFFVHESVFEKFAELFVAHAARLRLGPGHLPETDMGPLANARRRSSVAAMIKEARDRGAECVVTPRGLPARGYFHAPAVLIDPPASSQCMTVEPFGPIAVLCRFTDEEEAVRRANELRFGLAAYVHTRSLTRAHRMLREIEAGMVAINHYQASLPEGPFGGVKDSGHGAECGMEGLDEFLVAKLGNIYLARSH